MSSGVVVTKFNSNLSPIASTSVTPVGTATNDVLFDITSNITRGIAVDASDNVYVTANFTSPVTFASTYLTGASILQFYSNLTPYRGLNLSSFDKARDLAFDGTDIYVMGSTTTPAIIAANVPTSLSSATTIGTYGSGTFIGTSIDVDGSDIYFSGTDAPAISVTIIKASKSTGTAVTGFPITFTATGMGCNSIAQDGSGNIYYSGGFIGTENFGYTTGSLTTPNNYNPSMFGARLDGTGTAFRMQAQTQQTQQNSEKTFNAVVYPNPSTGTLFVKLEGEYDKENTVIEIMDGRGMIVHKENIGKTQNDFAQLDMKMFANGVYLVRITSGENIVYRKISLIR